MFKKLGLLAALLAALALPTTAWAQHGRVEHRAGHFERHPFYRGPSFGIYFGPGPVSGPYYGPYGGGYYDPFGIWHPYW
ncbi:MAG TPA: hypothetical protein VKV74_00880 [Bryobacteraceae bacterium]|nr:hypothetical protein [Bryobacteraceae bacterium]